MAGNFSSAHNIPAPKPMAADILPADVIGDAPNALGNSSAPYTLVEFADYECPPCSSAAAELHSFLPSLTNSGKMRFIFRNFPLTHIHPDAWDAACAAEAAAQQNQFWPLHDQLYAHQDKLAPQDVAQMATSLPLNLTRFQHDLKSVAVQRVKTDAAAAQHLHLSGTPTFILCSPGNKISQVSVAWLKQNFR